jgi:hypothetical protein
LRWLWLLARRRKRLLLLPRLLRLPKPLPPKLLPLKPLLLKPLLLMPLLLLLPTPLPPRLLRPKPRTKSQAQANSPD